MHVRDDYSALSLTQVDDVDKVGVISVDRSPSEPLSCYVLNGGPDYVLATSVAWHEDDGDHRSPSRFGPLPGIS